MPTPKRPSDRQSFAIAVFVVLNTVNCCFSGEIIEKQSSEDVSEWTPLLSSKSGDCSSDDSGNGNAPIESFRPLFNGVDLSGWVFVNTPPDTWSVQNGMLVCTGKPIGEIRTDRMFQNFILELEWRHMVPGGNAGVFVWADDITARGVPFHRSIEVQVLDTAYGQSASHSTHGDIFPIHGAVMKPVNGRGGSRAFPTEERSRPSPEWNHYRIECRDGTISLAVNHKVVTRGTDASPAKGYICLESEGGVVHYRNIRIHELPDSPMADRHVATSDRGYVSLYSGLDLRGWQHSRGTKGWESADWVLKHSDGGDAEETGRLVSESHFSRPEFIVDFRPAEKFVSIDFGADSSGEFLTIRADDPLWQPLLKDRNWHRIEISPAADPDASDGQIPVKITVDGLDLTDVAEGISWPPLSRLSIRARGAVELCNLYGKPENSESRPVTPRQP